jgi:hypothetical protein
MLRFANFFILIILTFGAIDNSFADNIYQEPSDFISEVFSGTPPEVSMLSVSGEVRKNASKILTHPPTMLRARYWMKEGRSAWILEEIGKTKPITTGFIIQDGMIEDVRILIYRESHGGEVRHEFFTRQFKDSKIDSDMRLSKNIDSISGATLSVGAIRRLASLALYFDSQARKTEK